MVEFPHALRVDGRFQLVALTYSPVYSPADVFGFAVFTSDGARLTDVVSLDQAHSHWSQLCEEEKETRTKIVVTAVVILLTALVGYCLAGYLTLLFLGLDTGLFKWNTYYQYVQAMDQPAVAPYLTKIKAAGVVGFSLPIVACLVALFFVLKPKKKSLHGDARFAQAADLAKHGLFKKTDNGIVVGSFGGKLVRLSGQQFVILAAPTRSGKGVGVVIPNLLEYGESVVVLDIKQENFDLTSGWRASQGHEVFLFNPFAEDRRTHRWNPLSYVSDDQAFRVSELMSIAAMLYPDGSDEQKFWISQARNAFMAFTLYLFENWDDERRQGFPVKYLKALSEQKFLSGNARSAFANLLSQADETFASIMGTFKEPLNAWINPGNFNHHFCNGKVICVGDITADELAHTCYGKWFSHYPGNVLKLSPGPGVQRIIFCYLADEENLVAKVAQNIHTFTKSDLELTFVLAKARDDLWLDNKKQCMQLARSFNCGFYVNHRRPRETKLIADRILGESQPPALDPNPSTSSGKSRKGPSMAQRTVSSLLLVSLFGLLACQPISGAASPPQRLGGVGMPSINPIRDNGRRERRSPGPQLTSAGMRYAEKLDDFSTGTDDPINNRHATDNRANRSINPDNHSNAHCTATLGSNNPNDSDNNVETTMDYDKASNPSNNHPKTPDNHSVYDDHHHAVLRTTIERPAGIRNKKADTFRSADHQRKRRQRVLWQPLRIDLYVRIHEPEEIPSAWHCAIKRTTETYYTNLFGDHFVDVEKEFPTVDERSCTLMARQQVCSVAKTEMLHQGDQVWATSDEVEVAFPGAFAGLFKGRQSSTATNCFAQRASLFVKRHNLDLLSPVHQLKNCFYSSGFCQLPDNTNSTRFPHINEFEELETFKAKQEQQSSDRAEALGALPGGIEGWTARWFKGILNSIIDWWIKLACTYSTFLMLRDLLLPCLIANFITPIWVTVLSLLGVRRQQQQPIGNETTRLPQLRLDEDILLREPRRVPKPIIMQEERANPPIQLDLHARTATYRQRTQSNSDRPRDTPFGRSRPQLLANE
uniref:Type IV secretory system conjugative DNA transfer family protein n=1 Tax=Globodera pallida TaxID=36090 RepID=A0A183CHY7_GLOPA